MSFDWYKRYPRDFIENVSSLSLEQIGAYALLLDWIGCLDRPLPDNDRYIAGLLRIHVNKWKTIKASLVAMGLIQVVDGKIQDPMDATETLARHKLRISRTNAGHQGGIASGISRKNKALAEANQKTCLRQRRGEERRGDSSIPTGIEGAAAPKNSNGFCTRIHPDVSPDVIDLRQLALNAVLQALTAQGQRERTARSIIGRWRKLTGDDDATLLSILQSASKAKPVDLVAWMERALEGRPRDFTRDCDGQMLVPHGTPEYVAWTSYYRKQNSSLLYGFPDKPGHQARAPSRWPPKN
jgi:uncharacterized protein YdaU (DUF1376 family)